MTLPPRLRLPAIGLALLFGALLASVGCSPAAPPSVSIANPVDGAVVTGPRTIAVQGSFANATSVRVAVDGGAPVEAVLGAGTFTAQVVLGDRDNVILATATGAAGTATAEVTVTYPFVRLITNAAASVVIGATDFTEQPSGVASPSTFAALYGRPYDDGARLFVGDYSADQVLVFEPFPTANGATAAWFMGSATGDGGAGTRAAGDVNGPQAIQAHDDRLYVLEYSNGRIQAFEPVPTATGAVGAFVIGKADFDDTSTACERGTFWAPEDFHIGGGRLVVADSSNNRVLVYLTVPTEAGALPDLVLGQADFTSCLANRGDAPAADTFDFPTGVWTDGERLMVADFVNHRVLVWTTFPTADGQAADLVLGQPDFTTVTEGTGSDGFMWPYFLDSNGNQLAVADSGNARILLWDAFPAANSVPADVVLGQADFAGADPLPPASLPTARNFSYPSGVAFGSDYLLTVDAGIDRALVFRPAP